MTKRGVPAIVIALIAALGITGSASARTHSLSVKTAGKLAKKLAKKQVKGRDVVSFHIADPRRIGRNRVGFLYDDRTTANVFCTASIVVTRKAGSHKTVIRARFIGQRCKGIPADVLQVESLTRDAVRALRGTTRATAQSLGSLERSVKRCRKLDVPKSRRGAVAAILDVALVEALEGPNDAVLGDFVTALGQVQTGNAALAGGIAGWADYLAAIRSLPPFPDPCATLQSWAQAGWAADQSPIDMAAYRAIDKRTSADEDAIDKAAEALARAGVFPRTVQQFSPEGLLLRLAPSFPGVTGGKGSKSKLTLRKPAVL
jgi:hypothetical protein